MLEAKQVAQAYGRWIADGEPDFQALMSPDLHDHVSGRTGPQTWDMVWSWIWKQLHVFAVEDGRLTEHWAVRDDLRLIEAIDAVS